MGISFRSGLAKNADVIFYIRRGVKLKLNPKGQNCFMYLIRIYAMKKLYFNYHSWLAGRDKKPWRPTFGTLAECSGCLLQPYLIHWPKEAF